MWNAIGSIISREESLSSRIEIKFANVDGVNKPEAFNDNYNFTMASLSNEGAFFANQPEQDLSDETIRVGSTVYYHAFPGQRQLVDANFSFNTLLPNGESAAAVASGRGFCAVATSSQLLRLFSNTGLQVKMISLLPRIIENLKPTSLFFCNDKVCSLLFERTSRMYDGFCRPPGYILQLWRRTQG